MADISSWFRSTLIAHAGTTALVGERVYFGHLPQNPTYPALAVEKVSALRFSNMGVDISEVLARVQVTAFAATRASVESVRDQVRQALQRARGTQGGVVVVDTYVDNEVELPYDDDAKVWPVATDFRTWFLE